MNGENHTNLISARYFLCAWLLAAVVSTAAEDTVEDFRVWGVVTATGSLAPLNPDLSRWKWWLEGQARTREDASEMDQAFIRTALGYALKDNLSLWLGYGHFFPYPVTGDANDENRIFQQLLWSTGTSLGKFTSRTRLEQRFFDKNDDTGWRLREMLKLSHPLAGPLNLVIADEVFINLNDTDFGAESGFDQNRAFAGFNYAFSKQWNTEFGYLNQYIDRATGSDNMNHILLFSLNAVF